MSPFKRLVLISLVMATGNSFAENQAPLALAKVPWPIIHQNNGGGKDSSYRGPAPGNLLIERTKDLYPGINSIHGRKYYYYQEVLTGLVKAFLPGATKPAAQFDLGASFPLTGGGVIDTNHNLWWTNPNFLIRLNEELGGPVYSERLPFAVPWNAVNLLPNGNLLLKSMKGQAVVIGSEPKQGRFPILQVIDIRQLTLKGKSVLANETSFEPRPVTDGESHFYFPTDHYLVRWSFDGATGLMKKEVDWIYEIPAGDAASFAVSNAVLIADQACINSMPADTAPSQVYCVQSSTGAFRHTYRPFPDARGNPGMHNLGVAKSLGLVYFLVNTDDDSGGIAALDVAKGTIRWTRHLTQVSNAYAISESAGFAYANARASETTNQVLALDLKTGAGQALHSYSSSLSPLASLFCIGAVGDLFVPISDGFLRIRNR